MRENDIAVDAVSILKFWEWFASKHQLLEKLMEGGEVSTLAHEFDFQLSRVTHELGWELGPGSANKFSLAFTLNGRKESIPIAHSIVCAAPSLSSWEFYVGKPPKIWNGQLRVQNLRGQKITLETSDWTYVLTGFDNNSFFDVELFAEALPDMDVEARTQVAYLVVESYLGEMTTLEKIDNVSLMVRSIVGASESESLLINLVDHMKKLTVNQ